MRKLRGDDSLSYYLGHLTNRHRWQRTTFKPIYNISGDSLRMRKLAQVQPLQSYLLIDITHKVGLKYLCHHKFPIFWKYIIMCITLHISL